MSASRRRWIAVTVALIAAAGLAWTASDYGRESLQMDFAAFWVAGAARNLGLSPYVNHVDADPPLWDGVAAYRHSRFLYPPLVADLFRPLAALPYAVAKRVWMGLAFGALVAAVALVWRSRHRFDPWTSVALAVVSASLFFPTRALLERGQIDSLTLLTLVGAWCCRRRSPWIAGALLALATLLKLHCVFLLPFLILGRAWRTLGGVAAGAALLLVVGSMVDGIPAWTGYVNRELPRIARHGEGGARGDRLPPRAFERALAGSEQGRVVVDGHAYRRQTLEFVLNASAVRTPVGRAVYGVMKGAVESVAPGHVSLVVLGLTFLVGAGAVRWLGRPPDDLAGAMLLCVVLLAAPVTWAMSVVWLLAVLPVVVPWPSGPARFAAAAATVAIGVAAVPDGVLAYAFGTSIDGGLKYEYVLVEGCVLVALTVLWWSASSRRLKAPA